VGSGAIGPLMPIDALVLTPSRRATGPETVALSWMGETIRMFEVEQPTLKDVLGRADLAAEPAHRVAVELCTAMEWHECLRAEITVPTGRLKSVLSPGDGTGLVLVAEGAIHVRSLVDAEGLRARLDSAIVPAELSKRLIADLTSKPPARRSKKTAGKAEK